MDTCWYSFDVVCQIATTLFGNLVPTDFEDCVFGDVVCGMEKCAHTGTCIPDNKKGVVLRVVVHLGMLGGFGGRVCGGVLVWWAGKNGRTHATTTKCIEDGWHDLMNLYVGHCMIRVIKCGQHVFGVMVGSVASYGAVHRLTHHGRQGKAKMNHGKADNG